MPAELQTSRQQTTLVLALSGSSASSLLQADIHAAVIETLSTAEADRSISAVVLTGLEDFTPPNDMPASASRLSESALNHLSDWVETFQAFPKPVIAAAEGQVSGPGLSLLLACDLVVAGINSSFSTTPMIPSGISWFINRRLPHQLAMEMLLADCPIPAHRLHALGLINRLAEEDHAIHNAMEWADQIASCAAYTEGVKALLQQASYHSLTQQFAAEMQFCMKN